MNKIKTKEELINHINDLRGKGKKIVLTTGSFDLFHYGHVLFLKEAKNQGDVLIIGLNSDQSVKDWKKHIGYKDWEKRPINNKESRAGILAACNFVDYVTIFDEKNPLNLVESIKPDVLVNGSEYGEDCIEAPIVKKYGGRVHIVNIVDGFSSSKMINKIIDAYKED